MRFRLESRTTVFIIAIIALLVIVVYPLARVVVESFEYDDAFSIRNYVDAVTNRGFFTAARNTLVIGVVTTILATIVGTLLAWVAGRTDIPWRRFFRGAFLFPFVIPPFIGAVAWKQILGPVGYLNDAWMSLTGADQPLWNMYGPDGIVFVLTFHLYPFVYLTVVRALERMNPELEEAARVAGSRRFAVMRRITLPLVLPAIASGATLVFIAAVANFGIPAILGFPENYYVLTTRIYSAVVRGAEANSLQRAAALSVLLGILAAGGLLTQRLILRGRDYTVISGKSIQPSRIELGGHRVWITAAATVFVLVATIAPVLAVLLTALTRTYGLPPVPSNWTLQNIGHVLFVNRTTRRAIRNSLFLATSAATIITFFGAVLAYLIEKTKIRGRLAIDFIANMPYALPGTVVAVAMILAWLRPIFGVRLYNTIWILLIAYVARYLAFGVRSTSAALAQVDVSLEEAARVSGAGWFRGFRDVMIPLIRPGLLNGWFLVFLPSLRELTISALLWSSRHETIGVMVFNLQDAGDVVGSAALAAVMMIVLIIANLLTRRLSGGRMGI